MPNKPIKQGYKIFALAEHGYIWTFSWSSRQLGIEEMFKWPGLTSTGSMAVELIEWLPNPSDASETLSKSSNKSSSKPASESMGESVNQSGLELTISLPVASYSIYMDNYFNSVALFQHLYDCGYSACGTVRPASGIPSLLQELKELGKGLPWGTLYALPALNVLCLAWQDNSIVLGLSTLHSADSFVSCKQKQPGKTSTNAVIARWPFEENVTKELEIPIFINDYNHYMNRVDLANQYRAFYEVHLKGYCTGWLFCTSFSVLLLSMPGVFNIHTSSSKGLLACLSSYSFVKGFINNSSPLLLKPMLDYQFNA
jgi:hypothetical protein